MTTAVRPLRREWLAGALAASLRVTISHSAYQMLSRTHPLSATMEWRAVTDEIVCSAQLTTQSHSPHLWILGDTV